MIQPLINLIITNGIFAVLFALSEIIGVSRTESSGVFEMIFKYLVKKEMSCINENETSDDNIIVHNIIPNQ